MKHATQFLLLAAAAMLPLGAARAGVLYVKADATGAGDGSSWVNACTDFNAALKAALAANGAIDEIWVAGTMHATNDVQHNVKTELTIRGGFAGTESSADERAPGVRSSGTRGAGRPRSSRAPWIRASRWSAPTAPARAGRA